jgi:predicted nucleotidyltransferase component of viral defense system
MKDHLLSLASGERDLGARLNLVREYVQAYILRSFMEAGAFAGLAFHGGTALRFLHGLRRFSEDLDFALERPEHDPGLLALMKRVERDFKMSGYDIEISTREQRTVHSAMAKFPALLHETGLSSVRGAKLNIRIEIDTHPPKGAVLETRLVTRHFPISFCAHDLRSCLSGKIHALLARRYTKGRDLFDLAWYLTHPSHPAPNLELLRNALQQTKWSGPEVDADNWRRILCDHVSLLKWDAVVRDVEPFLEDPRDRQALDRQLLLAELARSATPDK